MTKPVILTGLRANNDLTIGNYFGAILPMIDMATSKASDYQINMFVPDLHSFTTPINHEDLQAQILHNAKIFVAAGLPLDNSSIHLYRQSYISSHSELAWILSCFTSFGEMSRMTQFKDKSDRIRLERRVHELLAPIASSSSPQQLEPQVAHEIIRTMQDMSQFSNASVGLFSYPVLMAADILLYGARYVPVGDDQTQHLEFTRDIAGRMNQKFGELFVVPESVSSQHKFFGSDQGLRIKDLVNPTKKMSKSDGSERGVIFLGDPPEVAVKKVMGATTDDLAHIRYDRVNQPGISNLLEILALLRSSNLDDVVSEFEGHTKYGDFKQVVANELKDFLAKFQNQLQAVDMQDVISKMEASEDTLKRDANETLLRVSRAVGLRPKEG